jgi:lipoprotein NlpD
MMAIFCQRFFCFFLILNLLGCGNNLAPVTELKWNSYSRAQNRYIVKRGDTLFSIAFRYDTHYQTLARLNHINPPYSLRIGQVINLQSFALGRRAATSKPRTAFHQSSPQIKSSVVYSPVNRYVRSASGWLWPISGRVVTSFVPEQGKKGINIASRKGEKVIAAAAGTVAYAGNGLAGYGNLVIIRHNYQYLTAYGNNARIMVAEGQKVKAGQVIAEVGVIDRKYNGVHFEIRKAGVPVNPLNYLQKG